MHIPGAIKSFQYLGAKFSYLPWLLKLLPESYIYVEAFGGSGVVMANRKPSKIEVYNDLNHDVYNFFKVLRDQPEDIMRVLSLTPHSFYEYKNALYEESDSDLEKARKFFVRTNQSFHAVGAQKDYGGWLACINQSRTGMSETTRKWLNRIDGLPRLVDRFKRVQLECRDYEYIFQKYDQERALFYLDPPYPTSHRSKSRYKYDFYKEDFYRLRDAAKRLQGKVAISNYDTEFTRQLFKDFNFHEGPHRRNNTSVKTIHEALWTNY